MDKRLRKEGADSTLSWLETIAAEMEACDVGIDDALHSSNQEEMTPPSYSFHKVDDMYVGPIETPWILKQSELVRRLITTPDRCTNINQLRNLGKGCYEASSTKNPAPYQSVYASMTNNQRAVFWNRYNMRKRELMESIPLSDTAKALVKRIHNSRKNELPRLKANLVKLQKGQIKVRDPPNEDEWNAIWFYYSQRNSSP